MRKMCYTSFHRTAMGLAAFVLVLAAAAAAFILLLGMRPELLDETRRTGSPADLSLEYGYASYSADGVCDVALCGNPPVKGKEVYLYLTNPESNTVWLRAEIYSVSFTYDADGAVTAASPDKKLGSSGFIRPGEYVERVTLSEALKDDRTYVMIKISTYVESTQTSNGFFYVNTALLR